MSKNEPVALQSSELQETSLHAPVDERSEIAQEIINRRPGFWEKWALLVFLGVMILLLAGTWFIKYPDIVEAGAVISGENAPKEIIAQQTGKLEALFAGNNQQVKKDQIIGWLESTADAREILDLSGKINSCILGLDSVNARCSASLFSKRYIHLGELQTAYQTFIADLQQYIDHNANGYYLKKRAMLYSDIASLNNIGNETESRKALTQMDNDVAKSTFEMYEKLYNEKVISAEEFRQARSKFLNNEKTIPQENINEISQHSQVREKLKEIIQIDHDIQQQRILFEQSLHTLKSTVDDWLLKYTLKAPVSGQLVFILPLQQNQHLEQGRLLAYVTPDESRYFAEIKFSQNNFGKVDTGMKVQIRLDAYPYQEVGFVPGHLNYISEVAVDSLFRGTVQLDNGLKTNQERRIPCRNGLKGKALIITKDMRLLERLYTAIVHKTSFN